MNQRIDRQRGASMIEVLVSLTIVAFGLLGLAGLQARSMSFQKDSFDRKAAAEMASQLAERIRANYDGFKDGDYNLTLLPADATPANVPACANAQNCTSAEVAAADWAMWAIALRSRLPASAAYMVDPPLINGQRIQLNMILAWQEGQITEDPNQFNNLDPICASVGINDARFRCFQWILHP
jgi:type IV pilus modification protein PilV